MGRIIFATILILMNLALGVQILWSDQGFFGYAELCERYDSLHAKIDQVEMDNQQVSSEILRLRKDSSYQEKMVRERMNFLRPNEVLYLFSDGKTGVNAGDGDT